MKTAKNRTWSFPPTVEVNLGGKKVCKRSAYNFAYCLLTFAYMPAYCPAYLPSTGRAGSRVNTPIRLALWVENIACLGASYGLSQNQHKGLLK
jgi:hypothetical protein